LDEVPMADEHGPRGDDPGDPLDPAFADGSRTDDRGQAGPRRPAAPSRAIGRLAANAEPVVERVTSAARSALDAAVERWEERPGARVRRLRRLARRPLPSLYERHPEARRAFP